MEPYGSKTLLVKFLNWGNNVAKAGVFEWIFSNLAPVAICFVLGFAMNDSLLNSSNKRRKQISIASW